MIPSNLYDLTTMKEVMLIRGERPNPLYKCRCGAELPSDSFACTDGLPGNLPRFVCFTCASHQHRVVVAEQEAIEIAATLPWDSEQGKAFKIDRDRIINASLWTTAAGSPLTGPCQDQWATWRAKMYRLTIDFANPSSVVLPEEPGYEYSSET